MNRLEQTDLPEIKKTFFYFEDKPTPSRTIAPPTFNYKEFQFKSPKHVPITSLNFGHDRQTFDRTKIVCMAD